jgi:hypothetical protein
MFNEFPLRAHVVGVPEPAKSVRLFFSSLFCFISSFSPRAKLVLFRVVFCAQILVESFTYFENFTMEVIVGKIRSGVKIVISNETKVKYDEMVEAAYQKSDCDSASELVLSFDYHSKLF